MPRRSLSSALRRLLTGLLALALVLALADALAWRWAVGRLQGAVEGWAAARRAEGWTVAFGAPAWGGWPVAATLTLPSVTLSSAPALPDGIAWNAGRITLRAGLFRPGELTVAPGGKQRLWMGGLPPVGVEAAGLRMDLVLHPGQPVREVSIRGHGLRITLPGQGNAVLRVGRVQAHLGSDPVPRLSLVAENIGLPPIRHWALGPTVRHVAVQAALTGRLPDAGPLAARAAAWRESGGAVQVPAFTLDWGSLGAQGELRLGLDAALQPEGKGSVRLSGFGAALDALAGAGTISTGMARAAGAVLGLLAQHPKDGGPATVDLPLVLRDGRISLGPDIPLAAVPRLHWPGS